MVSRLTGFMPIAIENIGRNTVKIRVVERISEAWRQVSRIKGVRFLGFEKIIWDKQSDSIIFLIRCPKIKKMGGYLMRRNYDLMSKSKNLIS